MQKIETIVDVLDKNKTNIKKIFLNYYDEEKHQYEGYSTEVVKNTIEQLALGLHSKGVKKKTTFGIISVNTPQWIMMDMALASIGAISVPMFDNTLEKNIDFQIEDSSLKFLFSDKISNKRLLSQGLKKHKLTMIYMEEEASLYKDYKDRISFQELVEIGSKIQNKNKYKELKKKINKEDILSIVYTSGTTGKPKGVILTHDNLAYQVRCFDECLGFDAKEIAGCVLPLAHIYQRALNYYFFYLGTEILIVNPFVIVKAFELKQPTLLVVVPRILERMYSKLQGLVKESRGFKKLILNLAIKRAKRKNEKKQWIDQWLDKKVYSTIRGRLGGKIKFMVSGGAELKEELHQFFLNVGFPLYQGYGLTETSPVISSGYGPYNRVKSVGVLLPEVEIQIGSEGEILVNSPGVMKGYHNNPKETKEVLHKTWIATGDKGYMDKDGYLYIEGRKKELLKSSNGKYISPTPIESHLTSTDLFEYAMVVGDGRAFISCLLFPNYEDMETNKKSRGLSHLNDEQFFNHKLVIKEIKKHISTINKSLPKWEKIKKNKVVLRQLSIENQELTPKMNIKRGVIMERFKDILDEIYQET